MQPETPTPSIAETDLTHRFLGPYRESHGAVPATPGMGTLNPQRVPIRKVAAKIAFQNISGLSISDHSSASSRYSGAHQPRNAERLCRTVLRLAQRLYRHGLYCL